MHMAKEDAADARSLRGESLVEFHAVDDQHLFVHPTAVQRDRREVNEEREWFGPGGQAVVDGLQLGWAQSSLGIHFLGSDRIEDQEALGTAAKSVRVFVRQPAVRRTGVARRRSVAFPSSHRGCR